MTAMTMDFDGVRELSLDEIDEVNGALVGNLVSGAIGGIAGGAMGYITSGGDWRYAAVGAAGGFVAGAINPVNSAVQVANVIRGGAAAVGVTAIGTGAVALSDAN